MQTAVKTRGRPKHTKKAVRESINMGALAVPGVLLLLIFNYAPMFGIVIAFKRYVPLKGIWGSQWCGLDNFKFFFTSQDALRTIRNTMCYNIAWMIIGTIASVGLALMFYHLRSRRALKTYNTIMIFPKFLSTVILAFLAEIFLHPRFGLINTVLGNLGMKKPDWYAVPSVWPVVLTVVQLWATVGMASVIYYAALMSLDDGLLEAATLDGASRWQKIWHVMIPHLTPIIIIQNILSIGNIFNGDFGLFYQVPKNSGILYPTTDIINTYTFRALQSGDMSKSAAVGLAQSVAGLIMVLLANAIVKKISPDDAMF